MRYWDGSNWTTQYSAPTTPTDGVAVASLVLGLVGIVFFFFFFYAIAPILAIVLGGLSISRSRESDRSPSRMAKAGLILGICGLAIFAAINVMVWPSCTSRPCD